MKGYPSMPGGMA